ncbi:MAG: threonylcarbamoyl-AMP synthase [Proteobacteria bacterium]|nr:threonylcarbamoyl-AMP synthase [Pseudomonadota bacterium]
MTVISTDQAVTIIRQGGLVAFPTETVYGLGGNAFDDKAVASIYATKGRPDFNPLIIHFKNIASAKEQVEWNHNAELLAKAFWPGPLSLVLRRAKQCKVSLLASAGLDTLAVRVPANPTAHVFLEACDLPLAAPSANRSGRISPTEVAHVEAEFGNHVAVLSGERCSVGLESTVVDASSDKLVLLRPGAITREQLEKTLGTSVAVAGENSKITAPGMLTSHYAPNLPMRLNIAAVKEGEALLAFGPKALPGASKTLNLSEKANLEEAAANLFAYLRKLDSKDFRGIAVMPIPETGIGVAINDRLRRAAADKNKV